HRLRPATICALALALVSFTCRSDQRASAGGQTLGVRRYHGDGFSFDYPEGTTIKPGRNFSDASVDSYLLGPDLTVRADTGSHKRGYSVYSLELVVFPNQEARSASDWAASRFVPAQHDSSEGCGDQPKVSKVMIAGLPAAQVKTVGCDGWGTDYYLTDGRVVVGFHTYESDDELLQPIQNPFYAMLLSTFRWDEKH